MKKEETIIETTPDSHDSDNVRYMRDGKQVGFGYRGKDDGKFGLIRCPACERENYAMAVATGQCAWCGWKANHEEE